MAAAKEDVTKGLSVGEITPAEDYKKLIKEHVENCNDDSMRVRNFDKYSAEIRKIINSLIFKTPPASKESIVKPLKVYRDQACFYNPYDYNDWIKDIKGKLIEKKLFNIWEDVIVKNQLGLLWAQDCDFFDDTDDEEPMEFYKISAPPAKDSDSKRLKLTDDKKTENKKESTAEDKVTSADHYLRLVKEKVEKCNPAEKHRKIPIFDGLSKQVRAILTDSILESTIFDYNKIARDIKIYRDEACFYNPYDYNDWIKEIKIKITERKLFDFWETVIVKNDLGLLWAKNCDFFDDMDDDEPEKFYKINSGSQARKPKDLKEVGTLTPAEDYKMLVEREVEEIDPEREDEKMDIFDNFSKQIQKIIWDLVFNKEKRDLKKATDALKTYRAEACFYNPYDYNDWIKEVKVEIVKHKLFEFWENTIVKNHLGLLWASNCDFFDDMDDKTPENFYKIQK